MNLSTESLYANPRQIEGKEEITNELLAILDTEKEYLIERLSRPKYFIWLARKLPADKVNLIKELEHKGLGFIKENKRVYPNHYLASHLIGFAGLDNRGIEGLELYYDQYLKGSGGWGILLRDARRDRLGLWQRLVLPVDGYNLVLSFDEVIQFIIEQELDRITKKFQPKAATIIIIEPQTGRVLAWGSRPTYDLNQTPQTPQNVRRNRGITDLFEPGSVFKIVTAAAALQERGPEELGQFFCENGTYKVGNHILHDHRPHGWLSFKEVFEQSSNIGVTKIAQLLGPAVIHGYAKRFGFGQRLNIDLPGEIKGILKEPRYWSKTTISALPIGQEVGVTVLQLASAIAAIANKGRLMRPHVVVAVQDRFGENIKEFSPQIIRQVISEEVALRLKEILVGVIENGTGRRAKIAGMRVAGKTGTAQKLEADGSYSHRKFIASFIGFVPADEPKIAMAIVVDEPRPAYFGGVVCAPAFENICKKTLSYLSEE